MITPPPRATRWRPGSAGDGVDQVELVLQREPPVLPRQILERPDPRRRGVVVEHVQAAAAPTAPRPRRRPASGSARSTGRTTRHRPPAAVISSATAAAASASRSQPATTAPSAANSLAAAAPLATGGAGDQRDLAVQTAHQPRSTNSTRLPSGSARNANRTPGSGDGRGLDQAAGARVEGIGEQRLDVGAPRARSGRSHGWRAPRSAWRPESPPATGVLEQLKPRAGVGGSSSMPADRMRGELELELRAEPEGTLIEAPPRQQDRRQRGRRDRTKRIHIRHYCIQNAISSTVCVDEPRSRSNSAADPPHRLRRRGPAGGRRAVRLGAGAGPFFAIEHIVFDEVTFDGGTGASTTTPPRSVSGARS